MRRAKRDKLFQQARETFNAGDSVAALRLFERLRGEYHEDETSKALYGHFCNDYGSALAESGDPRAARHWFHIAQQIFYDLRDLPVLANIWFNLANVAKYMHDISSAERDYTAAMNLYEFVDDPDGEAKVVLALAALILDRGDAGAVRPLLARADRLLEAGHGGPSARWSRSFVAARMELLAGLDLTAALDHLEIATTIARDHLGPDYVSETQSFAAKIAGDAVLTADDLDRMEAEARATPNRFFVDTLYWLARVWGARGESEHSRRLYAESVAIVNEARAFAFGTEKNDLMERLAQIVHSYCGELQRNGLVVQALDVSEEGQGRSLLDQMFRHQIVRQAGRTIRAAGDGRVFLDSPDASDITTVCRELSVHVLKFLQDGDDVLAWFADTTGALTSWQTPKSAVDKLGDFLEIVNRPRVRNDLRSALPAESIVDVPDWGSVMPSLQAVYETLIPPEVRIRLEQQSGRLLVIPHQFYYHLPWAFLGVGGFRIGDRWEVSLAPSVGVFLQLDDRRDPRDQQRERDTVVLAAHREWIVGLTTEDEEEPHLVRFPKLYGTLEEADLVAEMTGARALVGEQASVEALLREMRDADVLHVAAHGYWAPEFGGLSFLLLDGDDKLSDKGSGVETGEALPGVVKAEQIADQITTARLVVLSGCQTGLGYPHPDSYLSVPHAFLSAGAKAVLMTLWPIADGAAVEFFRVFYRHLVAGAASATALAATQRELDGLLDPWDNASFVLLGNPYALNHAPLDGPEFCGGDLAWAGQQGEVVDLERLRDLHQTSENAFRVSADYQVEVLSKADSYDEWRQQYLKQTLNDLIIASEKADYLDD